MNGILRDESPSLGPSTGNPTVKTGGQIYVGFMCALP